MLNNSFEELEKKYKKLQRNKIIKNLFVLILIILSVLTATAYYLLKESRIKMFYENIFSPETNRTIIKTLPSPSPSLELAPSVDTKKLKSLIEDDKTEKKRVKHLPKELNMPKEVYKRKTAKGEKAQKKKELNIIEIKNEKTLKKDFSLYNDYKSALSLAKLFYEQKKYSKAIKWSIKASRYNPGADEPWIIYAKSKNAQNQKRLAIKALKAYLNNHKSKKVTALLNRYQKSKGGKK